MATPRNKAILHCRRDGFVTGGLLYSYTETTNLIEPKLYINDHNNMGL